MGFLAFLLSIACLIWLVPIMQPGRLFFVALMVLGLGTVLGPAFFAINGPIQISLDRVAWLTMFGLAGIGWRMGYVQLPILTRIDWMILGFVGWSLLSSFRGGDVGAGPPIARWLFYIAMPAGMYVIARVIEIRYQDIRWLLSGAVVLTLYLAITAVFEMKDMHSFVFPRFISNAQVWEFYGRGRGPLMNPAGNGIVITIGLAAAVIGMITAGRRGMFVYGVIATILLAGVYATLTRSVWVGAVGAAGIIIAAYSPRWLRVLGLASVVLLGGAFMMGLKDQIVQIKRDKDLTAADAEKSLELRPLLAVVAWEMFKERPLAGHGYGQYLAHNGRFLDDRTYGLPIEQARPYVQHNVLLSILVDMGLIGLLLFVGWLLTLGGIGWQLASQQLVNAEAKWMGLLLIGTLVAYLANGMFHDVMIIPMIHMFLFFLAGVAVTVFQRGLVKELSPSLHVSAARPAWSVPAG